MSCFECNYKKKNATDFVCSQTLHWLTFWDSHSFLSGHFAIALDAQQRQGNNATLLTPIHDPDDSWCFTFYYYLTGQDPGTLNAYLYLPDKKTKYLMWSLKDQKDNWNLGRLAISSPSDRFQVSFLCKDLVKIFAVYKSMARK